MERRLVRKIKPHLAHAHTHIHTHMALNYTAHQPPKCPHPHNQTQTEQFERLSYAHFHGTLLLNLIII